MAQLRLSIKNGVQIKNSVCISFDLGHKCERFGHISLRNCSPASFFLHYHCIDMVYTSPTKIAHIVTFVKDGLSHSDITEKLGVHHTMVGCIINRFNESEDFYYVRPKTGCPCILEEHKTWVAAQILAKSDAANVTKLQRSTSSTWVHRLSGVV